MTYKRVRRFIAQCQGVGDFSVVMDTSFSLQNVEVLDQVHGEGLPQEESLRKGLERLSVQDGHYLTINNALSVSSQ